MKIFRPLILGLLLLAAPAAQAQFNYTTNNGAITITGYNGSGGAVAIPAFINGLPVVSIGAGAFANNDGPTGPTSIVIPSGITSIGAGAFQSCYNLVTFSISASVTNIGTVAFANCPNLGSVYFMGNAPVAGSLPFSQDNNATVYYLPGTSGWGSTFGVRPATLLPFNYSTNSGAITITGYSGTGGAVAIPASLVNLPVTGVETNAFAYKTNLTGITIPGTVTNIGNSAFYDCTNLTTATIPYSVIGIGQNAFAGASLTTIFIPSSVTCLGDYAFAGCSNLTSAYFSGNAPAANSTVFSGDNATAYYLPATSGWNPVYASLPTALKIPYYFNTQIGLTTISTFNYTFSSLAPPVINIPATINGTPVTTIGSQAFEDDRITSVTIPSTVTSLSTVPFGYCGSLTNVYITGNAPMANSTAFIGDSNLTVYYFPGTTGWGSTLAGVPAVLVNPYVYTTNNGCITITGYAGPSGAAIILPATLNGLPVTGIGPGAFNHTSLNGVVIPRTVTSIGSQAFANASMTTVTIPASVTSIGSQAFSDCASLASVYFMGPPPNADSTVFARDNNVAVYDLVGANGWSSTFAGSPVTVWNPYSYTTNAGAITINNYSGQGGLEISIPATINGLPVTSVNGSFNEFQAVTNVTFSASVTNIGAFAFSQSSSLISVFFAGNAPIETAPAFLGDYNATVYYLPGTTGWGSTFGGVPAVLWNPVMPTGGGSFGVKNNQFGFNITSSTNLTVVVQGSTNPASPLWTPLQTVTLTNGSYYFNEPFQSNSPARFYRLSSP